MSQFDTYKSKAALYARYRWDYAPGAIAAIITQTSLSPRNSVLADIGSGTGILTRHFLNRAARVYAVEPCDEMRVLAEESLSSYPSFASIAAPAEATTLAPECVDVITVGQAIHWFEAEPARDEFRRIPKPKGWLALIRNYPTDTELGQALEAEVYTEENCAAPLPDPGRPRAKPVAFYLCADGHQTRAYPFVQCHTWDTFLGATLSAAFTPNPGGSRYEQFEKALHTVFDRFSTDGQLEIHGATELHLGQMSP